MKTFTVNKNSHNFKPDTFSQFMPKRANKFRIEVIFEESCLEDNPPSQWNKVGGITSWIKFPELWKSNKSNAQMLVFMAAKNKQGIYVNSYVNYTDTSFKFDNSKKILVQPEQKVICEYEPIKFDSNLDILNPKENVGRFTIYANDNAYIHYIGIDEPSCLIREIGAYYGGRVKSSERRSIRMDNKLY